MAPQREIFNQLTNRTLPIIAPDNVIYYRDIYDHAVHLAEEYNSYRDLVSGALDVYLSTVNNNLSLIMKRLTGITVVLAGLGAFAGIFGISEAGAAFAARRSGRLLDGDRGDRDALADDLRRPAGVSTGSDHPALRSSRRGPRRAAAWGARRHDRRARS